MHNIFNISLRKIVPPGKQVFRVEDDSSLLLLHSEHILFPCTPLVIARTDCVHWWLLGYQKYNRRFTRSTCMYAPYRSLHSNTNHSSVGARTVGKKVNMHRYR
ncbi:unnamed protein product, partial [Ectocarpus sp. 12 AP-2014]